MGSSLRVTLLVPLAVLAGCVGAPPCCVSSETGTVCASTEEIAGRWDDGAPLADRIAAARPRLRIGRSRELVDLLDVQKFRDALEERIAAHAPRPGGVSS